MFKDTSRYLDDKRTFENPKIVKQISGIYPIELHVYKSNSCQKETPFFSLI